MVRNKIKLFPLTIRLFVLFLLCSVWLSQGTAMAFRGRKAPIKHHGRVVRVLPAGFISLQVAGGLFYFSHGIYYKKSPAGFIVVNAPIGVTLTTIPTGYTTVILGGNRTYFVYEGTYYQKTPSGYVVVKPPADVEVVTPPITAGQVTVTVKSLNVRSGPGTDQKAITQVSQGNILHIIGSAPGWYYVQLPNGNFGWVMTQFTRPVTQPPEG